MHLPTEIQAIEFAKGIFIPFVSLYQILSAAYPRNRMSNMACATAYGVLYLAWICLFAVVLGGNKGVKGLGWSCFFAASILLGSLRSGFRARYNLRSNPLGDFLSSLFLWPQALAQLRIQCLALGLPSEKQLEDEEDQAAPLKGEPTDTKDGLSLIHI